MKFKRTRYINKEKLGYRPSTKNPAKIILSVSRALSLQRDEVIGKSRKREHVYARFISIGLIMVSNPRMGFRPIGRLLGNRHWTTIINGMDTFNILLDDNDFKKQLNKVIKYIN